VFDNAVVKVIFENHQIFNTGDTWMFSVGSSQRPPLAAVKISTCYSDRQYSGEERGYGRESSYRKKSQNRDFLVEPRLLIEADRCLLQDGNHQVMLWIGADTSPIRVADLLRNSWQESSERAEAKNWNEWQE
jgi:hypothetical protein